MNGVHITSQWEDISGGFSWVNISAADHGMHTGGAQRGFEIRTLIAPTRPAQAEAGEPVLVTSLPRALVVRNGRLWVKSTTTQFDAKVELSSTPPPPPPTGPTAPTVLPGDNSDAIATTAFVQAEIAGFVPWFDAATLVATNFNGTPPPYVDIKCNDGRDQRYQVMADYPVAVIERLGNPSFDTADFWGTLPGGVSISGGNLVYTAGGNVTQGGVRAAVLGGTYEITTVVSARSAGTLTPQLISPGTTAATPITSAGTFTSRVVATAAHASFRLSGSGFVGAVASASYKRVMTHACIVSADGLIWAPCGDINVMAYGVVADGTTDDTAALLNAISIAINMGRKALLPRGRMRVTGPILDLIGTSLVQIEGDPAGTVIVNEMVANGNMIAVTGRSDVATANANYLTANAAQGARVLTLNDTSQFTVGADIIIKDWSQPINFYDKNFSDDTSRQCALSGEINRVKSIDSATQLTLGSQLEFKVNARAALTGTVSTTSGLNTLTGVGTAFLTELVDHQWITIAGLTGNWKIRKITSNTAALLYTNANGTVSGAVATSIGGVLQRFLDLTEVDISGIRFEGSTAVTVPNTNNIISLNGVRRYTLRDLAFYATGCGETSIVKSLRGRLTSYHSVDAGKVGLDAYTIKFGGGCRTCFISDGYAMRPRHFSTSVADETDVEPAYIFHTGCHVDQPIVAAYDQHPGARNWFYTGCGATSADIDGPFAGAGFDMRGRHITVSNCQASGTRLGFNFAFADHVYASNILASGCDISLYITQSAHINIDDFISLNALTNDIYINAHSWASSAALPNIRLRGRGEGDPSGPSVTLDAATTVWGDDWRLDFRNPDATTKYISTIPSSHSHGIIDKAANFSVIPNLTCVYRTTGAVTATMPTLASDTGEATYTFVEVSGALTIDGSGAETIDGVASITPTGTVRVKKLGETGSWVTIG